MTKKVDLDWNNLGFSYIKTDYRYISYYKDGQWDNGALVEDNVLHISEASTALHYGQQAFEGLKAYRCKDGSINLFRPDQNAARFARSCTRLLMPEFPQERFVEAIKEVVRANEHWIPPYGTGGSLYIRPLMIGVGDTIGVTPAPEYIFTIFVMPVGAYFKGGLTPTSFVVSEYDRAAPVGTGAAKVGGNYAASLLPGKEAKKRQFSDCITKYSLLWLAEHRLGMVVKEADVYVDHLDEFTEAGACGTAAVISPIAGIQNGEDFHVFYSETEVGPVTRHLYDELVGIQYGDVEAPEGWIQKV